MVDSKSEIDKMTIYLTDNDNTVNAFPLERQNNGDSVIWKFQDGKFEKLLQIEKSETSRGLRRATQ